MGFVKQKPFWVPLGTLGGGEGCTLAVGSLAADPSVFVEGDTLYFDVTSTPAGLRVFWSGTKDSAPDLTDFDSGALTPLHKTWVAKPGTYSRVVSAKDSEGKQVCQSNTITFKVLTLAEKAAKDKAEADAKVVVTPAPAADSSMSVGMIAAVAVLGLGAWWFMKK